MYTTTNGEGENKVIQLTRYSDGSLGDEKSYSTGAKGGSDHAAPAHGDYDAQGATKIVGNCLLTCNTGANSIAVFHVDKKSGSLHFVANTPSHGTRPVTIGWMPVAGSENEFWILVGNQWNTPTVIYDGDKLQRLPSDDFFKQDLTKPDPTDKERTVQLFKLNSNTGTLTYQSLVGEYNRQNGGPCDVKFSPDGTKLAVTLWGVPHFLTAKPILKETRPS
ncbi:MAG: beta-propeller fold lactonase family protein [Chitinophagaceae bacterium]|nr:beta-propeller fold lactonase family protein [Chitinophagaceae bacterium]